MKKTLFLFLGISLLLTNCKKDDDGQINSNFLEIGNTRVGIVDVEADDYGINLSANEVSYNIDLIFYNTGPSEVETDDSVALYIEANSSIENRLAVGVYEFSNSLDDLTFSDAYLIYRDFDVDIQRGTLEVLSSSIDSYEVIFEGVDVDGNDVVLEFGGSVDYFQVNSSLKALKKTKKSITKKR